MHVVELIIGNICARKICVSLNSGLLICVQHTSGWQRSDPGGQHGLIPKGAACRYSAVLGSVGRLCVSDLLRVTGCRVLGVPDGH